MKRGYIGTIGNEFVFVVAKSIDDAKEKFKKLSNGKKWEFDSTRQFKALNL